MYDLLKKSAFIAIILFSSTNIYSDADDFNEFNMPDQFDYNPFQDDFNQFGDMDFQNPYEGFGDFEDAYPPIFPDESSEVKSEEKSDTTIDSCPGIGAE